MIVLVMGVVGAEKTTVGRFADADDLWRRFGAESRSPTTTGSRGWGVFVRDKDISPGSRFWPAS